MLYQPQRQHPYNSSRSPVDVSRPLSNLSVGPLSISGLTSALFYIDLQYRGTTAARAKISRTELCEASPVRFPRGPQMAGPQVGESQYFPRLWSFELEKPSKNGRWAVQLCNERLLLPRTGQEFLELLWFPSVRTGKWWSMQYSSADLSCRNVEYAARAKDEAKDNRGASPSTEPKECNDLKPTLQRLLGSCGSSRHRNSLDSHAGRGRSGNLRVAITFCFVGIQGLGDNFLLQMLMLPCLSINGEVADSSEPLSKLRDAVKPRGLPLAFRVLQIHIDQQRGFKNLDGSKSQLTCDSCRVRRLCDEAPRSNHRQFSNWNAYVSDIPRNFLIFPTSPTILSSPNYFKDTHAVLEKFKSCKMAISEPKSAHLREVLLFAFNWKKSATEAHRMLEEVYGDHALSKSQCYRWFKKFQSGDFEFDNEPRGKPPQKFEDAELQALLDEDSTQTQEKLAKQLQVSQGAVSLRLNSLGMTQKLSRWVSHELSERQQERRLDADVILILQHDNATVVKNTIKDLGWELLPHPPYSPDIAPSDYYHLFTSLGHALKNQEFSNSDILHDVREANFLEASDKHRSEASQPTYNLTAAAFYSSAVNSK
ncbi:hypothetical protein LAZ67_5002109 [Cordylochernes scorpioides]|uniref:Mos1 transposase HTH domain-containing protein n=1 Tax=Cordylochernes scorpioides TaxID=51811 RepID=A0ABY6KJM7_9ARAC|nr:hypothetical protein LAZ67_5002109 [Cordylochernes scorpioides]